MPTGQAINHNPNANSQLSIATNPFQYDGYYSDSESGNYYLNARYCDPTLGIFLTSDSYNLPNRYMYVNGNPVMATDPTGHFFEELNNWVFGHCKGDGGGSMWETNEQRRNRLSESGNKKPFIQRNSHYTKNLSQQSNDEQIVQNNNQNLNNQEASNKIEAFENWTQDIKKGKKFQFMRELKLNAQQNFKDMLEMYYDFDQNIRKKISVDTAGRFSPNGNYSQDDAEHIANKSAELLAIILTPQENSTETYKRQLKQFNKYLQNSPFTAGRKTIQSTQDFTSGMIGESHDVCNFRDFSSLHNVFKQLSF